MAGHMLQLVIEYATTKGTRMKQPQLRRMLVYSRRRAHGKTKRNLTKWIKRGAQPTIPELTRLLLEIRNPWSQRELARKIATCF